VKDTWREVIETIVFVVVLVLLLKSFTAEAFVIPTGSMAETLWGYQKLVTCPQCTYEFPVNCSSEVEGKNLIKVTHCMCPNCRYEIVFDDKFNPSCNTGDRVLVAKHLNDLHVLDLERLDVVVFKFPEEPQRDFVPMNYIKRLIGLPGETIGILNGDIYIAKNVPYEKFVVEEVLGDKIKVRIEDAQGHLGEPITLPVAPDALITRDQEPIHIELRDLNKGDRGVLSRDPSDGAVDGLQVYRDLPLRRQTHRNYPTAKRLLFEGRKEGKEPVFQILRKAPDKVLALRRIVYDNNHQAKDLLDRKVPPRWAPERDDPNSPQEFQKYQEKRDLAPKDGWTSDGKFGFQHKARTSQEIDWLRYRHLIVDRRTSFTPEPQEIKDFMGYNTSDAGNWVGDLILELKAEVKEAEGELILELSKGDDRFQARFDLSTGTCRLLRITNGSSSDGSRLKPKDEEKEKELAKKETSLKKPGTYRLRFANVDERLIVWVDGSLPFGHGVPYEPLTDGEKSEKAKGNDLEPASIGVRGGGVNVSDLSLWRDTYYTNSENTYTLYVQPGHYLCMGDNSPASSDSRSWGRQDSRDSRGGLVPERLMLGRALLVYWPFWPAHNRVGPIK
jgi:signal peptidase I